MKMLNHSKRTEDESMKFGEQKATAFNYTSDICYARLPARDNHTQKKHPKLTCLSR